ncbi:SCP2 sterol-binding domain-containing protein [Sutcliffiella deserti]|uniref:SCP2 sterol-binding domain-containing protein n=1 Tax=Sutcliffiella deserti TaxID=2875501 RepID=UPI001CBF58AB|nr:SCP2 sterol-binding domain-containing protein [Sutcliffiella deserti]
MDVEIAFQQLVQKMNQEPEGIKNLNAIYQFDLSEGKTYQFSFEKGHVDMFEGSDKAADCTLQLSDENVLKMIAGDFNTTMAYMTGKLKVKGELGQALKLQSALEKYQ